MKLISPDKGGNAPALTVAPVAVPGQSANPRPEFLRLPKPGTLCPVTGLTRSFLNSLILPTADNQQRPPVKSVSLRQRGAQRGVRLIAFDSLLAYLHSHLDAGSQTDTETARPTPTPGGCQ